MTSPYSDLPPRAFWRQGVAERGPQGLFDLYTPKFRIEKTAAIMTAGSCFAQHVGRTLRAHGFNVLDAEPVSAKVPDAEANRFGYRLYSARYGNVYTAAQLHQLIEESLGRFAPEDAIWQKDGRFYDALRPNVEPEGLDSPEEVTALRQSHLRAVRGLLRKAEVLVFTLGLTEAWVSTGNGTVYPTAPGTIAGSHDPERVRFHNFGFAEVRQAFLATRQRLLRLNPGLRFLLTVSPVPLTATASGQHVEVATAHSKAVLRAVAGELAAALPDVDYFPSYEIITSQTARGAFYEPNLRSVTSKGVETAMSVFMKAQGVEMAPAQERPARERPARPERAPRPRPAARRT